MNTRGALLVDCGRAPGLRVRALAMAIGGLVAPLVTLGLAFADDDGRVRAAALALAPASAAFVLVVFWIVSRSRLRLFEAGIHTGWRFIAWERVMGVAFYERWCEIEVRRRLPEFYLGDREYLQFRVPGALQDRVRSTIEAHRGGRRGEV